jgi:heme A synthase
MAVQTNQTSKPRLRRLRILIVAILVILTVQGWTGDVVNIFFAPASGTTPPPYSISGFFQGVESLGPLLIWHGSEGIVLIALSIAILALSFKWSKARSVRICAILATVYILASASGGFLFLFSGFSNGGNSAPMGGSFIGSYAFYFMELYYSKGSDFMKDSP